MFDFLVVKSPVLLDKKDCPVVDCLMCFDTCTQPSVWKKTKKLHYDFDRWVGEKLSPLGSKMTEFLEIGSKITRLRDWPS